MAEGWSVLETSRAPWKQLQHYLLDVDAPTSFTQTICGLVGYRKIKLLGKHSLEHAKCSQCLAKLKEREYTKPIPKLGESMKRTFEATTFESMTLQDLELIVTVDTSDEKTMELLRSSLDFFIQEYNATEGPDWLESWVTLFATQVVHYSLNLGVELYNLQAQMNKMEGFLDCLPPESKIEFRYKPYEPEMPTITVREVKT